MLEWRNVLIFHGDDRMMIDDSDCLKLWADATLTCVSPVTVVSLFSWLINNYKLLRIICCCITFLLACRNVLPLLLSS